MPTSVPAESRVTIHMVASLDDFIARRDGSVDWLEVADTFDGGKTLDSEVVTQFLATIMQSRPWLSRAEITGRLNLTTRRP